MSNFFIYDKSKARAGMLQNEDSVQWLENYQSPGEVKIEARATPENKRLLADGNRIYNTDSDTVARITHTDIADTATGQIITARAQLTAALLGDRVVMATENITAAEAGMYSLYSKNRRNLPIGVGNARGYSEKVDTEITWGSVLDAQIKVSEASGLGFKVLFNPETAAETFTVYKGIDRSKESNAGYTGYFGSDVENIQNVIVSSGTTNYKNVAIVAGEDSGSSRKVRIVSLGSVSGENRRELYVDARDLQSEYQEAKPTGEVDSQGNPKYEYITKVYTPNEYNALLDSRGREKLAEHLKDFSITCDITQTNIEYGVDYFLGDRMPVKLPELGIAQTTARIASVNMIYERQGKKIVAQLSEFELEGGNT